MSSRVGWGRLIAAVALPLAAGCSPRSPAPRPSTEAPRTFRLGSLRLAAPDAAPTTRSSEGRLQVEQTTIAYGRGTFFHTEYTWLDAADVDLCPTRGAGPTCGQFWVSSSGQAPATDWRLAPLAPPAAHPTLRPAPRSWDRFSPTQDAVYAHGYNEPTLDRIDEQGHVTTVLSDDRLRAPSVFVLEVGASLFALVGGADDQTRGVLYELRRDASTGAHALGASVGLTAAPLPPWGRRASHARQTEGQNLAPMLGAPVAVSLADKKNPDAWGMVWVEALPPPINWPENKPYKRPGRRTIKAKNSCGGRSSRPLTDASVEKRIHLTRFQKLKLQSDVVLTSSSALDPRSEPLQVAATDRGVLVNGVTYNRFGSVVGRPAKKAAPPAPPPPPPAAIAVQSVASLDYDPATRTGVLTVLDGPTLWRRSFDAEGVFLGPPRAETLDRGALPAPALPNPLPVWGDEVVLTLRGDLLAARWLRTNQERPTFETVQWLPRSAQSLATLLPGGPLLRLPDGTLEVVPPVAGPPIAIDPQPDPNASVCPRSLYTSPRTVLMACSEALDFERPGIRVGLRKLELR